MIERNLYIKMPGNRHYSRADTLNLKTEIERKVGRQTAERYFIIISKFFNLKLSKTVFNKLCIGTIGIENVSLHNHLIRAIITNACLSKTPPLKRRNMNGSFDVKIANNGCKKSSIQSLEDVFVLSPKRERTRVLRLKDQPSSLAKVLEQETATELVSIGSKPPCEGNSEEDGEEVEQTARSPVRAPLGFHFNGKATKNLLKNESTIPCKVETCHSTNELPTLNSLKSRLEKKLEIDGFRVSDDFVHLLNNGLNIYLKRLIKPCLDFAASKLGQSQLNQDWVQSIPGLNGTLPVRCVNKTSGSVSASLIDFRAAMELNPSILGEDWPIQFEQICFRASEECRGLRV